MAIIELVKVDVVNKGKYQEAVVQYRKDGKLGEKKVMSFTNKEVFNNVSNAMPGIYEVTNTQNEKGFWEWSDFKPSTDAPAVKTSASPAPRNTYETPEERAQKQKYIVRQSSITNAISFLELDKKRVPTTQEVIEIAKAFENFVFGNAPAQEAFNGIAVMEDDVPL